MTNEDIITLLQKDIEDEHGAIIQYLTHAYSMGEGEMACEIEAIARDEMRHLDWLAEAIVELGGTPSLERGTMKMDGTTVSDWMGNNVFLENGAIQQYENHIKSIDNPKVKRLLKRILADEQSHHGSFDHFVNKSKKAGMSDIRGSRKDEVTEFLNWSIEHEYTVIIQYLLHSYTAKDPVFKEQMEDQAINEMQHLGWLAEEMVSGGGNPKIEFSEIDRSTKKADMLKADIKIEKEVAAEYDRGAKEFPDLKRLLLRIRDNELYHVDVFNDLLEEEE